MYMQPVGLPANCCSVSTLLLLSLAVADVSKLAQLAQLAVQVVGLRLGARSGIMRKHIPGLAC